VRPKMVAQDAFSRLQYARKHFSAPHRWLYMSAVALRHVIRGLLSFRGESRADRRKAARLALSTLAGRTPPPFGPPPATALPEWPQPESLELPAVAAAGERAASAVGC
jgi:hypothetical protein